MFDTFNWKDNTKILSFALILIMIFAFIPRVTLAEDQEGEPVDISPVNVTKLVSISKVDLKIDGKYYYKDGQVVDESLHVKTNSKLEFLVYWEIDDACIKQIKAGDFFVIPLPTKFLQFTKVGSIQLYIDDKDESVNVGTYSVEEVDDIQQMKVVFNENVCDCEYIKEG